MARSLMVERFTKKDLGRLVSVEMDSKGDKIGRLLGSSKMYLSGEIVQLTAHGFYVDTSGRVAGSLFSQRGSRRHVKYEYVLSVK